MRPLDPRLLSRIGPARGYVVGLGVLGTANSLLVLAQALLIARLLAPAIAPSPLGEDGLGPLGAFIPVGAREPRVGLVLLCVVIAARALVAWASERVAQRAGSRAIAHLRRAVVAHTCSLGPRWLASGEGVGAATLAARGLDGLLPYFVRYLPTLITAATVTPIAVLVVFGLDITSAIIVAVTLPLIPLFMTLIGRLTQERTEEHLASMQRLASRVLDLITGLPTLRALGRSRGPAGRIREFGEAHRKATMASLRVAFLSGMVLELLATLSVALVAVSMGFRLAGGGVSIETALAVLVLAPEVYWPLRNLGSHFHASADGLAAAEGAFTLLAEPLPPRGIGAAPRLAGGSLGVRGLSIATPDGRRLAPHGLTFEANAGEVLALTGPNGDGKSTALMALAGLIPPTSGSVVARAKDSRLWAPLADPEPLFEAESWARQCAWVPQRPDLGPDARRLSLGERQQRALARALAAERPVLLLDEPSAHLDGLARGHLAAAIRAAAEAGAIVVVATHDPALMAMADRAVEVRARQVSARAAAQA